MEQSDTVIIQASVYIFDANIGLIDEVKRVESSHPSRLHLVISDRGLGEREYRMTFSYREDELREAKRCIQALRKQYGHLRIIQLLTELFVSRIASRGGRRSASHCLSETGSKKPQKGDSIIPPPEHSYIDVVDVVDFEDPAPAYISVS